jgi:DNA-binding LacI/PurR family transcriptional regulator
MGIEEKATVSSLARDLGLSTCTVSKILNRSFDGFTYAAETIRRVENAAKRKNYIPNAHARSLRTNRSMTIALVVPGGIPYFSGTLVENIERELRPLGYETIVGHSTGDPSDECKLIKTMLGKGIDGLLWIPYGKKLGPKDLAISDTFPLVLLDRPGCSHCFPTVMTDNEAASLDLAKRIRDAGHGSVVMLTAPSEDDSLREREAGIRKIFGRKITLIESGNEMEDARRAIADVATKIGKAVLVCLSQNLALGALMALMEKGIVPGVDVGFASFDDLPMCEIWQPSITRIQQNLDLLAKEAVRLLTEKMQNPGCQQSLEVRIPAKLTWGSSVPTISPTP